MLESLLPGLKSLQNPHPLVVHFPIAFLLGAVFLYMLSIAVRREGMAKSAFACLLLGAISALVAAGTGLYAEEGVMVGRSVRAALLEPHEQWMLTATGLSVVLALWAGWRRPMPQRGKSFFLILLVVLLAVIAKGADFGGRMVYEYNAGGSACGQPIELKE
ncbi:MAG TPA: DUF2231 domain-containing protein [bacterium]|nr:DUF2231 domain-containing protein [bacterium]